MSKPKSNQRRNRDSVHMQHRIIARYDFDARRWVHSSGVVLTPREATLLEGLAKGISTREVAQAAGMKAASFFNSQSKLKHYFGIPLKTEEGRHQLLKIAMDLYGPSKTPHGEPQGATVIGKLS